MVQVLKYALGLCFCLCLASCAESDKERLSRLVSEWEGKEILFPAHSTFTIQGKDTVDFDFKDVDYKIVTYVDSVGCMSCKLYLSRWKSFIEKVYSIAQKKVAFLFFIHSGKRNEISFVTRREDFLYPICVDEYDKFCKLNNLPLEKYYVSFLLDSKNKVLQKGNPAFNLNYQEIYLKILSKTK